MSMKSMKTNDVVEATRTEDVFTYESVKGKTYEFIGSHPSEWRPAEIKGFDFDGNPIYVVPPDFKYVETMHKPDLLGSKCRLCSHRIKQEHILLNNSRKQYMIVGSECVNHHYGKVVKKEYKIFKDNEIRKEFKELLSKIISYLDSKKEAFNPNRLEYWAWKEKQELMKIVPEETTSRKLKNIIDRYKKLR